MAENNAATEAPPRKARGKLKLILLMVVAIVLAIGLSIAGTLWFLGDSLSIGALAGGDEDETEAMEEPFQPALYLVMDKPLVTTVRHPERQRYVQVHLAFEAADPAPLAATEKHMPLLRNRLISELATSEFMALQTLEGRQQLPQRLLAAVNEILEQEDEPPVRQVLLRNFVVQ